MALYFSTSEPPALLETFVNGARKGHIKTWSVDDDGDFTHTAPQWEGRAWLCPQAEERRLALYILNPKDQVISTATYATYHGRVIESMLIHCDDMFEEARATADPEGNDIVSPEDAD